MLKIMKKIVLIVLMFTLLMAISACHQKDKTKKTYKEVPYTVHAKATTTSLFYTGTLEPIKTLSVFSPVDGRVHKIYFKYGDSVKEGEKLVSLSSEKLVDSYRTAVSDYLTKKATFVNGIQTYQGNIALHDAGVISDSTFINDKNTYETNLLSFYQSRFALEKVLKQAGMSPPEVEALSLDDTRKLNAILEKHFKSIMVDSPGDGVALFPLQQNSDSGSSSSSGSSVGSKLLEGANVSQNQLLLSIGDLAGLSVNLAVSEIDINRLKDGLPAVITGDGFPGVTLNGSVTQVSSQADPNQSSGDSGLSMFTVVVQVPKTTAEERKVVRVGMTSKVQVIIKNPPQILVPINAVRDNNGQSEVELMKNGKPEWTKVLTGETTVDNVRVVEGLKDGDVILIRKEQAETNDGSQ